jgi:hypothetical protein
MFQVSPPFYVFIRKIIMQRTYALILLFFILGIATQSVYAEGSLELTANGGSRTYLEESNSSNAGGLRRTDLYVYAKQGETINLASSAVGVNLGSIDYVAPDGTTGTCSTSVGIIANLTEELAKSYASGYCVVPVTMATEGVWKVNLVPPKGVGGINNPVQQSVSTPWVQDPNDATIAAWDIQIKSATNVNVNGRVFTNSLAMNLGGNTFTFKHVMAIPINLIRMD